MSRAVVIRLDCLDVLRRVFFAQRLEGSAGKRAAEKVGNKMNPNISPLDEPHKRCTNSHGWIKRAGFATAEGCVKALALPNIPTQAAA